MNSKLLNFIKPFLSYIDSGRIFRNPFSWLYSLIAIANIIFPIYLLYKAIEIEIYEAPFKVVFVFLLLWVVMALVSWFSFQLWWDRKSKVIDTSAEGDDFLATPVFSHLIQTLGEWMGMWIGIVGFVFALLTTLILGNQGMYIAGQLGIDFLETGFLNMILMPVYGFLIIVTSRFLAEQFRALAYIANNIKN